MKKSVAILLFVLTLLSLNFAAAGFDVAKCTNVSTGSGTLFGGAIHWGTYDETVLLRSLSESDQRFYVSNGASVLDVLWCGPEQAIGAYTSHWNCVLESSAFEIANTDVSFISPDPNWRIDGKICRQATSGETYWGDCRYGDSSTLVNCPQASGCSIAIGCNKQGECTYDSSACECTSASGCEDNNPCTTNICNSQGNCEFIDNSVSCDDGNFCTSNDTCSQGLCAGSPNSLSCNDLNPCTLDDICSNSICGGVQNTCDDGLSCSVDSCNPIDGSCLHITETCSCINNSQCDDNNPCTDNTCSGGQCTAINNTAICSDNNNCTTNTTCSMGSCSGIPKTLDDGNLLTLDRCLTNGTVTHTTSFNLSAHLENQDIVITNPYNSQDPDDDEQIINSSNSNPDNSEASLPGQDAEDDSKINTMLLISIVLIVLVLIGFAIFVLPGIINRGKKSETPSTPNQAYPRGPPRRMPPRR